ncbi:MAG TPA: pitrilysin family protein [Longimicrobiales bacterium]|nr:pitrilysin family protein [Longimicrobiales bacterium]
MQNGMTEGPAGGPEPRVAALLVGGLMVAALAAAAWPGAAAAQEPGADPRGLTLDVVEDTLPNGLRVLVLRRAGTPTASLVLRFDVGSVNERLGETGIAHFLEHLLFKGTTTVGTANVRRERELFVLMDAAHDSLLGARGRRDRVEETRLAGRIRALEERARELVRANEFDRLLTEAGARDLNATTSYESTTYYAQLPANRVELWFVLEADRMANPVFREFYAERDVVAEERRSRLETTPGGRLLEEFYAAAYRVHPYGVPVIGHMSDIQAYTRAQVADYHRRFYRPNNAVLSVVGDVDPRQILRWAHRYFGPIPAGEEPPPVLAEEPEQTGERRIEVAFEAEPELLVGWHVPHGRHDDAPALSVLARILAGGKTGRLYRRLVEQDRLATSVTASTGPGFAGPQLFMIAAQPLGGHGTAELEAAIYAELDRLREAPPTEREIQRVRNQLEAGEVHRLSSNFGLAFQLVESAAVHGDWRETFRTADRLAAVGAPDVLRVAATYLVRSNRTVATLVRPAGADAMATGGRP